MSISVRFPLYSKDRKKLLRAPYTDEVVKVSEGTEIIAQGAFEDCAVRWIELPNSIRLLDACAIMRANSLEGITLPDSIEEIGKSAFLYSAQDLGIEELTLPKNLHRLGAGAFYGCNIKKLTVQGDFKWEDDWLNDNPFYYIDGLSAIENANPNFSVADGMMLSADGKILFRCVNDSTKIIVPEGTEIIAQGAFYDRRLMETVVLPNSLKTICRDAFSRCSMLDDVILPEGTEMIGWEAFCLCSNLKRITLPRSMKKIESGAFKMCNNLKEVVYPKGMKTKLRKMMENGMAEMPF